MQSILDFGISALIFDGVKISLHTMLLMENTLDLLYMYVMSFFKIMAVKKSFLQTFLVMYSNYYIGAINISKFYLTSFTPNLIKFF